MDLLTLIKEKPNWIQLLYLQGVKFTIDNYEKPKYLFCTYDYNCKFDEEFTKQCRGSLIDLEKMEYICRPFDKFFNYGENHCDDIDFSTAKIREKLDGSLIKVFWFEDKNRWQIATNGTFDANGGDNTFYLLTKKVLENVYKIDDNYFNENFDKDYTYMFELCTPENIVVIPHKDYKMYFLSKRNKYTGDEIFHTSECSMFHKPKEYDFKCIEDILANAEQLSFMNEGYVVSDKYGKRVKIKSSEYVALHHRVSDKTRLYNLDNLFKLRNSKELSEISVYYPIVSKYLEIFNKYIEEIELELLKEIHYAIGLKLSWTGSEKDFNRTLAKNIKYRNIVFEILNRKFKLETDSYNYFERVVKSNKDMYDRFEKELKEVRSFD